MNIQSPAQYRLDVRTGRTAPDCASAVVTANVTESVCNRLQVRSVAHFRRSDGGPELDGTVVNLTGSAAAAANLAINPDALSKQAYRATVSLPGLNHGSNQCAVGRTGRVIFSAASCASSSRGDGRQSASSEMCRSFSTSGATRAFTVWETCGSPAPAS